MANSVKFMNEGFNKLFGITEEKSDNTNESITEKNNRKTDKSLKENDEKIHEWFVGDDVSGRMFYSDEDALAAIKSLMKIGFDEIFVQRAVDESFKTPNYKKIHEMLTKMDEASMSDEDRKENDLLRSIYSKRMNRANAKLTPEEQAVLDKYGLYTDFYKGYNDNKVGGIYKDVNGNMSGVMISGRSRIPADIQRGIDDTESHGAGTDKYATIKRDDNGKYLKNQNIFDYNYRNSTRREKPTKQPDQINYVDRARKLDDRVKSYQNTEMNYFNKDSYTYDNIQKPGVEGQRDRINKEMQSPLNQMKGALNRRKEAQTALDNAKDVYNKANKKADDAFNNSIANATRQRDYARDYAKREYDRDSNPKYRDAAQAEIDSLLKKNK